MALTGERKKLTQIPREIEIFSIFAWLVPTSVPKQNLRFPVFCHTICWLWWLINIYETFGAKKITVSLWNPVSAPGPEIGANLRTLLFVNWCLQITKLCTEESNSVLKQNTHFGIWEKKYLEMEFWLLGNASSPFCRTEWFPVHGKIAFFHLSVWLIGPGDWKLCYSPWFNSWQFAAQAVCRWAEIENSVIF